MTVKELIAELQTLDPDLRVFTDGYEGGYEDVVSVGDIREIALSYHDEWWYGPHVDSSQVDKDNNYEIVKGVVL